MGSPWFAEGNAALAKRATQVFISTLERSVPFDIFAFYRGMHTYAGVDSLAMTASDCAPVFEALRPGFEDGTLRPFEVAPGARFALDDAQRAYRAVLAGAAGRMAFVPGGTR